MRSFLQDYQLTLKDDFEIDYFIDCFVYYHEDFPFKYEIPRWELMTTTFKQKRREAFLAEPFLSMQKHPVLLAALVTSFVNCGGVIDQRFLEPLLRLHEVAVEHDVPFINVYLYALREVERDEDNQQQQRQQQQQQQQQPEQQQDPNDE